MRFKILMHFEIITGSLNQLLLLILILLGLFFLFFLKLSVSV